MLQTILTKKFKLNLVAERDVILTFHGSDVLLFCQGNLNRVKNHVECTSDESFVQMKR